MYDKTWVEQALLILWEPGATVQMAKEPGMPSSSSDPRKAQDPHVMMIDMRRAWDECEWLTRTQRRAIFAYAVCGTQEGAAELLGISRQSVSEAFERGLTLLVAFLNSTYVDREQWEDDLRDMAEYGHLNPVRQRQLNEA